MHKLLSFLFYTKCVLCRASSVGICKKCLSSLELANENLCPVCLAPSLEGKPHISCFDQHSPYSLFIAYEASNKLKRLLLHSKQEFYALKILTRHACLYAQGLGYLYKDHVVVYKSSGDDIPDLPDIGLVAHEVAKSFKLSVVPYGTCKASYKGKAVLLVLMRIESKIELHSLVRSLYQSGAQVINCFVLAEKVI